MSEEYAVYTNFECGCYFEFNLLGSKAFYCELCQKHDLEFRKQTQEQLELPLRTKADELAKDSSLAELKNQANEGSA